MDPFPKQNFFCKRTNIGEDVLKNKEYTKKRKIEGNSKSSLERNDVKPDNDDTIYECEVNSQDQNQRYDIEIGKIERRQISEMMNNFKKLLLTIKEEMKGQSKNIKDELETLKSELNKYKNETKSQFSIIIESSHNKTEIKKIILKEKCKNVKNITEWIKCLNINVDFIWKIDRISLKKGLSLFSEAFYSNNYKLRLYYNDYYGGYSQWGFSIMRGDNDNRAEWPLRLSVTLSTMNQVSLRPQHSETLKYDTHSDKEEFERPKSKENYEIFGTKISKNDHSLSVFEDSLIIYCVVTPP